MADQSRITRSTRLADLPEYLTPEELAAFLGLGLTSVYSLIKSGEINSRRFGRLYRIPRNVLTDGGSHAK